MVARAGNTDGRFRELTRRRFLQLSGLGVGGAALLTACGEDSPSSTAGSGTASPSVAGETPKTGGMLRMGVTNGSPTWGINPMQVYVQSDACYTSAQFEPLIIWDENQKPVPWLAEEMEPNADATAWTIRLREGVTFHNGRTANADDLVNFFRVVLDPENPSTAAPTILLVDAANITKLDNRTVRVPCLSSFATFMEVLPGSFDFFPADYDPENPVGTGPFVLESFAPGERYEFSRNANYWVDGQPYLDGVTFLYLADETAQLNALASGQIDAAAKVSEASVAPVEQQGNEVVISEESGSSVPLLMHCEKPPFNDVRVREAMCLIADRPAFRDVIYGGHGMLGNDVFSRWDPAYDESLIPQRERDLDRAKALLKQAGVEGLEFPLDYVIGEAQALLFQQQAADAGVKVNPEKHPIEVWFTDWAVWPMNPSDSPTGPYLAGVAGSTLPTAQYSVSKNPDPAYAALYSEAIATVDETKRHEICQEMMRMDHEACTRIIPNFTPVFDAVTPHVHGVKASKTGYSFDNWNLRGVWMD